MQRLTGMLYRYNGFALHRRNMKSIDGGSSPAKSAMASLPPLARRRRWNWKQKKAVRSRRQRPDSSDAHRRPHPPTQTRTWRAAACLTNSNASLRFMITHGEQRVCEPPRRLFTCRNPGHRLMRCSGCNFEPTNEPLDQRGIDFRHDTLVA